MHGSQSWYKTPARLFTRHLGEHLPRPRRPCKRFPTIDSFPKQAHTPSYNDLDPGVAYQEAGAWRSSRGPKSLGWKMRDWTLIQGSEPWLLPATISHRKC